MWNSPYFNLAIVGHGFVGKAVDYGFTTEMVNRYLIDPMYNTTIQDLFDKNIGVTFICVPTPMGLDGRINSTILEDSVIDTLENTKGLVVIKSTVIPSIVEKLASLSNRVIYNPEFLTEKNALQDFVNPIMHVFGGEKDMCEKLYEIYKTYSNCSDCPVKYMTAVEASFVKYAMNTFLMSKVVWFNQLHSIIEEFGGNFETIRDAIGTDSRIGHSHTNVPGHDGRFGAGGSCFSKDGPAFFKFTEDIYQDFTILKEVILRNQEIRNSYGEPLEREKAQHIRFDYEI